MRKIIIAVFTFLIITTLFSFTIKEEYFTGKIVYDIAYFNTKDSTRITEVNDFFSPKQTYYTDANNYKSYRENGTLEQLFNAKTNKYYFYLGDAKKVNEIDATQGYGAATVVKNAAKETILGYECSSITFKKIDSETTYFYSDKIKVNPKPFLKHYFGNWNQYLYETNGALPLKYSVKTKEFYMISTATSVEKMKLGSKDFDIKKELPAIKNQQGK